MGVCGSLENLRWIFLVSRTLGRDMQRMLRLTRSFFLVMNVAVGGTGYFPDDAQNSPAGKPWNNESPQAPLEFWNAKDTWYPTWKTDEENGELAAMKVEYVKVWAL